MIRLLQSQKHIIIKLVSFELRWLRCFVSVAEEMHFSRAARKLNLAQPALTTQIKQPPQVRLRFPVESGTQSRGAGSVR